MAELVIRGGLVIDPGRHPATHTTADVHVVDGRIEAVGPDLDVPGAAGIDGRDCVVLPGLVDTHRHGWQSVLRAAAPDDDLGGYFNRIIAPLAPGFTAADVEAASLLTGLECLDAGVTTLLDYSHINFSPDHAAAAVAGLRASGVRAVLGYGRPVLAGEQPWRVATVRRVREELLHDDADLVTMMLAAVGPSYTDADEVRTDWALARELDLSITTHVGAGPVATHPIAALDELCGALPGTVYVHANSLSDDELRRIADTGGTLSITPAVEARMGHGAPTLARAREFGVTTGLGVDVVTTVPGDLFSVMRAALLSVDASGGPRVPMADVLHLATAGGAATLGMADRIGTLRPGAQADLVLLRADAVSTACAHDPVALAVNAHPGVVDTVLVAGRVVKRHGRLLHPGVADAVAAGRRIAQRLAAG